MSMRRVLAFAPLTIFLILVGFFAYRLNMIDRGDAPNMIPSVMINKPMPTFLLPALFDGQPQLNSSNIKGKVTLVNVFASWCVPCRAEHPYLEDIKKAGIILVGINYEDHPQDARQWLAKLGNPYDAIGSDLKGRVGIDFGVYGVPESYLIDKQGIIRYKQTGPLTPEDIQQTIVPLAKELNK